MPHADSLDSPDPSSGMEEVAERTPLERIRRRILLGDYSPGEHLKEERLAEDLEVSRTPVRQALTMLEAEGLVRSAWKRGAMVCSFGVEEVWEIYDLRAMLEGHAARRAAAHIREDELESLRGFANTQESIAPSGSHDLDDREEEVRRLVATNQEFHGAIVTASRNGRLEKLLRRTVEVPLMYKAFFWYTSHERTISNHYHRQIIAALQGRDAERADILMREHVYEGRDFVIRALEEDSSE